VPVHASTLYDARSSSKEIEIEKCLATKESESEQVEVKRAEE
jgi:hypothetical protein